MIKKILLLLTLIAGIAYSQADTSLIFSEIMFSPTSGPNEFIEIYNLSNSQSFDLSNIRIKYYTSTPDQIVDAGFGTTLPPQSYAIVFENDYDLVTGIYSTIVPPGALVLKIADNSFGSSGMANTSDRPLWMLNAVNDTLDRYTYSADNPAAISDEKIVLNRDSLQTNWANSLITNGTPGFTNSVTPVSFDLQLTSLTFSPINPVQGSDVNIFAKVKNLGSNTAVNYSVEIYNDANIDSIPDPGELIFSQNYANLTSSDSIEVVTAINNAQVGTYQIIARVVFLQDENPFNNQQINGFTVFPPGNNFNDIVVNEIMYAPTSPEPEWIELYNRSASSINLNGWKFSDASTTITIINQDFNLSPSTFVIVARDSSILNYYSIPVEIIEANIPALNNTGDAIVLKDPLNVLIDSLFYFPAWGGNTAGRSLERISVNSSSNDPTNWGTSVSINKATPGLVNSVTPKDNDLAITEFISLSDFGIVGEQIQFDVAVKNIGLNNSNNFNLLLFRDANNDSIPQTTELIITQQGSPLQTGDSSLFRLSTTDFLGGANFFIAKLETSIDDDSTNNIAFESVNGVTINEIRNDLVINEIMYAPTSPQPEWIEIFNRSNKIINLKNYRIADANDTTEVVNSSIILSPDEFVIIAKDTSIISYYEIPSQVIISSFSALNNTNDKVIILDSLNRVIDSLAYNSSWGGTNGKSLERISPDFNSADSTNWLTSTSIFNATPGKVNSVTQKDFDIELSDILFTPQFPLEGQNVSISITVKNIGKNNAQFSLELYEDIDLDSIPDLLRSSLSGLSLNVNDSTIFHISSFHILNIQNLKGFYARAIFPADEDTTNNFKYRTIQPGYPPQTIVINEIMYAPLGGEPEWIELFNNSTDSINLNGWSINDVITTPITATIRTDFIIEPNGYVVLTKDTTILNYHRFITSPLLKINLPSFNNDLDGVILKDNRGVEIDSVLYSNQWGGTNGFSLERISSIGSSTQQINWGTSIDIEQSTPGRINSITSKLHDVAITELSFEPRFPVNGDDVFIKARVQNFGLNSANCEVLFYMDSDSNNVVDLFLGQVPVINLSPLQEATVQSLQPITNIQSKILAAAQILYLLDEDSLNNYFEKSIEPGFPQNVVKINEVMYNPADGKPEWFELVNTSSDTINIKNWGVGDVLTTPTKNFITVADELIAPNEIFIVARDSSFNSGYPNTPGKKFFTNFGTLGNTSDGIVVYDFRNGIIDSLFYRSSWGGSKGVSIERISLSELTNDSTNWTSSLSINGSTPGKKNSILNLPSYARNDLVINEIMYDPDSDNSEFVEFYNLSNDTVNIGGWQIEDENGNRFKLSSTSILLPPASYFVLIADSNAVIKYGLQNLSYKNVLNVSSLGLVNTGELILLKDVKGNIVDSVYYDDNWNNSNIGSTKNKSLERINPRLNSNDLLNWSTAVNPLGGTPGLQNSIFAENLNNTANISVSPNPFSPDNDGFEDFAVINYNLTQPVAQVRIKIYDSKGRLVRTLLNNQASGSNGSVIFDGLEDNGEAMRMGIYIIFMEALNDNSGVVETLKTVVVVARKL